jgi:Flp pilus assembly protein TadG
MKPDLNRTGSKQRGQSLIEFTLVMPMMFVLVTGMLSFGIAMHDFLVLTNSVNAGAQVLGMSRGQTTDPCSAAYGAIHGAAPSLTPANLTLTFVINGTTYSGTSCTSGAAGMAQGTTAQVTASYPCRLGIYGLAVPSCNLQAQTSELIQ